MKSDPSDQNPFRRLYQSADDVRSYQMNDLDVREAYKRLEFSIFGSGSKKTWTDENRAVIGTLFHSVCSSTAATISEEWVTC